MSDTYGSGLSFGGEGNPMSGGPTVDVSADPPMPAPITQPIPVPDTPVAQSPAGAGVSEKGGLFGTGLTFGAPSYKAPDPAMSALDQSADMLTQRVKRANEVATNPILQFFNPEGVQKAREFVPQAAEALQKIKQQQAGIMAGKQQAQTLGLAPGEVPDEASTADRVEVAKAKALKGDLRTFKGLQAVDPKAAEAIQDQVQETVASHLTKAQFAFDSLASVRNQGEYMGKLSQLRKEGALGDLEALGLKVPASFDAFMASKGREGQALREARIGVDTIRQKLEERNTYQPMEEKEAKTYNGRMTTVHGDQITNGTWGRNASAGTRGLIVNGAADPRDLGKKFTLATPEQRKAIAEEVNQAIPKADLEKQRAFDRTYELATKVTTDGVYDDGKGGKVRLKKGDDFPAGSINTNPNVQQGIAEGLASMLRGGTGGANVGLLNIETGKRGVVQGVLDSLKTAYAGGLNTLTAKEVMPYLTKLTQQQQRDVLDGIKAHNDYMLEDRVVPIARRAGALGLDTTAFGFGKDESTGAVAKAIEQGRNEQIERMLPNHQAIGGGDGVFQLGAQRPGANAVMPPGGTAPPTTQLPGAPPVATPVQQAQPAPPVTPSPGGGSPPSAPLTIAGQQVAAPPMPPGTSPNFIPALARIETGNEKNPWTAEAGKGPDGKQLSSASGAYQFLDSTWMANRPPGATATRAKDATPEQQTAAFAAFTAKNAKSLQANGMPVNDTTLYMSHNLGAGGAMTLLRADPNADARTVVGGDAARNNPTFFKGRPTVAKVLERYTTEMNKTPDDGPKPRPGAGGATAEAPAEKPGLMTRISRMLSQGVAGGDAAKDKAVADIGNAAVEHAPAIGSTLGAVGGSVAGPGGTVVGGAAGGGAGQSLKDYLQGRAQNPTEIAKQTALGGVLGIMPAGRPVAGAVARTGGAAAVEGGAAAIEGKDAADIADATLKGGALAAGGELFGRALGMAGHKVFNMFAPEHKAAIQSAAGKFSEAEAVLAKEAPTLPGVNGGKSTPNPAYLKAEAERMEAERVLKDAGLKPEEAAYAHKVSSEGVPKQEAEVSRPGALEKQRVGEGYQQLESEVGAAGQGAVRATVRQRTHLDASENLSTPRPPTSEELAKHGRVESVPLSEVRSTQSTMQWDRFNKGDHPPEVVKGFADKPVAVRKENGEYMVIDGHHRAVKAANAGKQDMEMYVIDAKTYDPAAAGRKKQSSTWTASDDELLRELGGASGGTAKPRGGNAYNPILTDGPMVAVTGKKVSAVHAELAERTEAVLAAPAANWQAKWVQLKDARSALLDAERDARSSTAPGRTKIAEDMRVLADTVRVQQEKAAKYVFGEKDGAAFMERLKTLDVRYRRLMEATNGGEIMKAAAMKGEAGRDAEKKFVAFAHDDPQAVAAYRAIRGVKGDVSEATVPWTVAAEGIPGVGKIVKVAKLGTLLKEWARERAAGSPVKFSDLVKLDAGKAEVNQSVRDLAGTAAQRFAVQ